LELGGKGAAIVFDDADLRTAVGAISSVWAFHSGQICTAPTRVIAQRGIYDRLVAGLQEAAGRLKVGDPLAPDTVVGPVISAAQRDRIEGYVRSGVDEGGTLLAGGERPDLPRGFYVAPALIADCKPEMRVVQEEIFGPVVVALPFDDEDEAVALANGTEFGLNDYVFTGDTTKALRVARRLRSGTVAFNTVQQSPEAPFGGFKRSGVGRDRGSFALHAYSELQSIVWPGWGRPAGGGDGHEGHRLERRAGGAGRRRGARPAPARGPGAHPPRRAVPQRRLGDRRHDSVPDAGRP